MRTVADITSEYNIIVETALLNKQQAERFCKDHQNDERKGILNLVNRMTKRINEFDNEVVRVQNMLTYEKSYAHFNYIGGVDEAGRGPLAGPVVAACVILKADDPIFYVDDSKKLSAPRREALFEEIKKRAVCYGIGVVSEEDIDTLNILNATYKAMRIAIESMEIKPEILLNDAVIIPDIPIEQVKIIHGDAVSLSIAAASILAKVTRDQIMTAYDELFPEYGFKDHKGYGSSSHIETLRRIGPCPIHRQSFIKNFVS